MPDHTPSRLIARRVPCEDKQALRRLLDDYLQELAVFGPVDAAYPHFDLYWDETDRWAYRALAEGRVVGFALVNRHSLSGLGIDHAMAEFQILPGERGKGYGAAFARALFAAHPGVWELGIMRGNRAARHFWRRVTAGLAALCVIEGENERIFRFESQPCPKNS